MLSWVEGHELLMSSLRGLLIVYLDIFLELLGPANCVAKITSLVRGINSSRVDYVLDCFTTAPVSEFWASPLGISVRHKRISAGDSPTGEDGRGTSCSPWGSWRGWLVKFKIAEIARGLVSAWAWGFTLGWRGASWRVLSIGHILSSSIAFKVAQQILTGSPDLVTRIIVSWAWNVSFMS